MGGLLSSQFKSEFRRIGGDIFFQVDKILRVLVSTEKRFIKLGKSFGYVEN